MIKKWTPYRNELSTLLRLGLPILLAQVALTGLGVIDTIMSGRVGTDDLAAIGLASSLLLPIFMIPTGILLAISVLISQADGQKNDNRIACILNQGIWLAIPLGLLTIAPLIYMKYVLDLLTIEPKVYQLTQDYLLYIAWGMPAIALYQVFRFFLEGLSLTIPTMLISLLALLVNIPINAVFIYGWGPMDAYGAAGCGIASAIVMWLMLISVVVYILKSVKTKDRIRLNELFSRFRFYTKTRWQDAKKILSIGVPITLSLLFEVGLFSFIAIFIAHLGSTVIAANQVTLSYTSVAFMIPLSISMAIAVRVGQMSGQKNIEGLILAIKTGILLGIALGVFISVISYFFKENIAQLFTSDQHVIVLVVALLGYVVIYQVFDAIQAICAGALRGLHSTKVTMYVTFVSYWLIGLGGGYLFAFTDLLGEPMGVQGYWQAIVIAIILAAVALSIVLMMKLASVKKEMLNG